MVKRHLMAELAGAATGHRYQIDLDKLDDREQRELLRLIQNLKSEVETTKRRARNEPWRFIR